MRRMARRPPRRRARMAPGVIDLEALAAFSEVIEIAREMDNLDLVAYGLEGAAPIFASAGDPAHAATLLGAASCIRTRIGDARTPPDKTYADDAEARCREALTPEAFTAAWEQGAALDTDAAAEWALQTWERTGQDLREASAASPASPHSEAGSRASAKL